MIRPTRALRTSIMLSAVTLLCIPAQAMAHEQRGQPHAIPAASALTVEPADPRTRVGRGVHVVIRVNVNADRLIAALLLTDARGGAVGEHFVDVHVALRAGTGLPDGQRKFIGMIAGQNFICCLNNRSGLLCGQ